MQDFVTKSMFLWKKLLLLLLFAGNKGDYIVWIIKIMIKIIQIDIDV